MVPEELTLRTNVEPGQSQRLPLEIELTFCRWEKEENQTAKGMGLLLRVKLGRGRLSDAVTSGNVGGLGQEGIPVWHT